MVLRTFWPTQKRHFRLFLLSGLLLGLLLAAFAPMRASAATGPPKSFKYNDCKYTSVIAGYDDGSSETYSRTSTPGTYKGKTDSNGNYHIVLTASHQFNGTAQADWQGVMKGGQNIGGPTITIGYASGCTPPGTNPGGGTDTGGADSGASSHSTDCSSSGFSLGFFMCPIYDGAGQFSDWLLSNIVQPFLRTSPVSTNPSDPSYKVWSMFRVYGDIFLVIALLVVVFGQSIGGGLVDAYTAKKVLPRLLIAAILINLSIYIVAFLVDVTNVIGGSIGAAMTAPLDGQGLFQITPSGLALGEIAGATAIAGAGGILAFGLAAVFTTSFFPFIGLFVLMPAVLALIVIFVTLALRKAIILALILVAPVAFALYCLPNTEQYFRKWWDVLVKALMIYPVVMIMFAVCDILAVTVVQSNNKNNALAVVISFLLQFLPLLFIPYAMRLSGSAIASVHDAITEHRKRGQEAIKGNVNDPWSLRNQAKRKASNAMLASRENFVGRGSDLQDKDGKKGYGAFRKTLGRGLAGVAGHGNYEELRSRRNKEAADMLQMHVATGGDDTTRALFARQNENGEWIGTNGERKFAASEVAKARSMYGKDPSMYQAALTYELGKAANDQEMETTLARHQENMDDRSLGIGAARGGIWAGSKFAMQNTRKHLKHTSEADGGRGYVRNSREHTQEVAEAIGSYPLSNMRVSEITALREDHDTAVKYLEQQAIVDSSTATDPEKKAAQARLDQIGSKVSSTGKTKAQITSKEDADKVIRFTTATAQSLDQRRRQGGSFALVGEEGNEVPGTSSGAPGLVEQELSRFVDQVLPSAPGGAGGGGASSGGVPPAPPSPPSAGSGGWQSGGSSGGGGSGLITP
jgi:hypothetical protein